MTNSKSLTPILCFLYVTICYSGAQADRLIRRSDMHISLGVGTLDEQLQTVTFTVCGDKQGNTYSLKDYVFEKGGKDCERPPIFVTGKILIESTSIAAGIGVSWGAGKLSFKEKDY